MRRLTTILALLALLSTAGCLDERAAPAQKPRVTWRVVHSLDAGSILEVGNRCAEPVACLVCDWGGELGAGRTLDASPGEPVAVLSFDGEMDLLLACGGTLPESCTLALAEVAR